MAAVAEGEAPSRWRQAAVGVFQAAAAAEEEEAEADWRQASPFWPWRLAGAVAAGAAPRRARCS